MVKNKLQFESDLFGQIKSEFLDFDPAHFVQDKLTIDGAEFRLDSGWHFMEEVYRYICLEATLPTGKPVVFCKSRQVGATIMATALDLWFTNSNLFTKPSIRVVHLFPDIPTAKRFSQDKLEGMIRTAKDNFINKNKLVNEVKTATDNLSYKQFKHGSLWVESTGVDGDRTRGMTVDVAFFDECQDILSPAINNTTKTLLQAKYGPPAKGVQIYFGTPKEKGSFYHTIWELSDQRYYHLGCTNCDQTYPFYIPGDDSWQKVWLHGFIVKCPHCGKEQHKTDAVGKGKWVPSRDPEKYKYRGYHINQFYPPNIPKEAILDEMPDRNPDKSDKSYHNEVLGEFYSAGSFGITAHEIYEKCRDPERKFSKSIDPKQKLTYLGADWGGKIDNDNVERGQSYSAIVVLSANPDGTLSIEHAHKLEERSYKYKMDTVHEMFRRFGIRRAIADAYWGTDVVPDLTAMYDGKFLGAQGSGNLITPFKFREEELIVGYNKDLALDELFDLLRKGRIRFPYGSYDLISWLIEHVCSMQPAVRSVGGQTIKTYKKGNIPNDGLMALMYAFMAYKFDKTKGFTEKPGIKEAPGLPMPILAHAPRLR